MMRKIKKQIIIYMARTLKMRIKSKQKEKIKHILHLLQFSFADFDSLIHCITFPFSEVLISGNSISIDVGNAGVVDDDATQRGNVGSAMLFVGDCLCCAAFVV